MSSKKTWDKTTEAELICYPSLVWAAEKECWKHPLSQPYLKALGFRNHKTQGSGCVEKNICEPFWITAHIYVCVYVGEGS